MREFESIILPAAALAATIRDAAERRYDNREAALAGGGVIGDAVDQLMAMLAETDRVLWSERAAQSSGPF